MVQQIRKDQDRQHLRNLLLDGVRSAQSEPVGAAYVDALRDRIRRSADG